MSLSERLNPSSIDVADILSLQQYFTSPLQQDLVSKLLVLLIERQELIIETYSQAVQQHKEGLLLPVISATS